MYSSSMCPFMFSNVKPTATAEIIVLPSAIQEAILLILKQHMYRNHQPTSSQKFCAPYLFLTLSICHQFFSSFHPLFPIDINNMYYCPTPPVPSGNNSFPGQIHLIPSFHILLHARMCYLSNLLLPPLSFFCFLCATTTAPIAAPIF